MTSEQSDIRSYLKVLWRWKLLMAAVVAFIPAMVFMIVSSQPKVYESSVLLQVQPLAVDTSLFNTAVPAPQSQTLLSAARLITTTRVARVAAVELGEPRSSARRLLQSVTATADVQADFISVAARAGNGERAAAVANAFARAVVSTRASQAIRSLDSTIGNVSDQLDRLTNDPEGRRQLSQQLQRLRALRAAQGNNARIVEPAVASSSPVAPRVLRTVTLSAIVALLLAFGAVVLAQGADRRIRDPLELEALTGRPLLSAVPNTAFGELQSNGAGEEAFQTLRASLTYFNIDRPIQSVLVSSPMQGDGKTTVATNLARAMARAGKDVILVDADLRRPQVASRLHVAGTAGLGGVLVGESSLEDAFVEPEMDLPEGGRLRALPAGPTPPNPAVLLASQRMKALLTELTEMADLVVIDSTPLLTVSDSLPLVEVVSGVVAIARLNVTSKDAIGRLEQVITNAGGTLLGSVVTGSVATGLYGGYGYGYGYTQSSNGDSPRGGKPRSTMSRVARSLFTKNHRSPPAENVADEEARPREPVQTR